jgi:hypothetical protein
VRLDETPIPDGAEERAWRVVSRAYAEQQPVRSRRPVWKPVLIFAAAAAAAGLIASPPGRSFLHSLRKAVGVQHAEPELFRLPAPGRLLVRSAQGLWVVQRDGSRRLLRGYVDGSWSPHGLYLAGTKRNELVALEANGHVHWTLPRPGVRFPRWTGSFTDTRIAFLSRDRLHVVAGNGRNDRDVGPATPVAPAWRPGKGFVLAYATRGDVLVYDTAGSLLRRIDFGAAPTKLEWSSDGKELLVLAPHRLRVYDAKGRVVAEDDPSDATRDVDATFVPGTHAVAVIRRAGAGSNVLLLTGVQLFRGTGLFSQLVPSPDGRWLLVAWPTANQWVFLRLTGPRRIVAAAGVTRQFGAGAAVAGWCCG